MRNPKKPPKKCEWKGCEKRATTSLAFGGGEPSKLCAEHKRRRAKVFQWLSQNPKRHKLSPVKIWWLCHGCWRAFEAEGCAMPCPFCNGNSDWVRRYSQCRADRVDLPLVPVQGKAYPYMGRGRFAKSKRYLHVDANDLSRVLAGVSEDERVYITAKVDLRCEAGIETRVVKTAELKGLLAEGRVVKCHVAQITWTNVQHQRTWQKLRNRILRLYGHRCMRCGLEGVGKVHVDHIQSWQEHPERRYDPENLQLLCRDCHTWKHRQVTEWDFRPKSRISSPAAE